MASFHLLFGFVSLLLLAFAHISVSRCEEPRVRREWRTLTAKDKRAYVTAVQCIFNKPAIGKNYFSAVQNRFDDFVALHINASQGLIETIPYGGIHMVGVFLPWHRYVLWAYETALIQECGYNGTQPYWDWTLDMPEAGSQFNASPVFDSVTGFGGNGVVANFTETDTNPLLPGGTGGGCITDGPFVNTTLNVGPGKNVTYNPRCISRNINPTIAQSHLRFTEDVLPVISKTNFSDFRSTIDPINGLENMTCHGGGHIGVGGEMGDLYSSPSDPLFYLHHAQLDRIWANWQEEDLARLLQMAGPTIPFTDEGNTTLDTMIWMGYTAESKPIRTVMDTMNRDERGFLCYKYAA